MRAKHKQQLGFTIVELLIVIVVIAILAAISIVAYNGMQSRARNTQQISAARGYQQSFASYLAANGKYPASGTTVCLGLDQPACTTSTAWGRDLAMEASLKTITPTLPTPSASIPLTGTPKLGYLPSTFGATIDGVASPLLVFNVEPPNKCTLTPLASGAWPNFSSTAPAQGYTYDESSLRVCVVALPKS